MSDLPFEALIAPRVEPKDARPHVPVNWFERIASRLPEASHPDRSLHLEEADAHGARPALFADVSIVSREERKLRNIGILEAPDIIQMRKEAREQTQLLLNEAREQAKIITQQAEQTGYKAGYEKGYADGEHTVTEIVMQRAADEREALRLDMTDFLAFVEAERQRIWAEIEPQAIDLIFALCKQVIKQEIEVSRTIAIEIIRNALRRVTESGAVRIRVHPDDLENVRSHRGEFLQFLDDNQHVEIVLDRRVGSSGCIIETEAGSIDSRIETQLAQIGETLEQIKMTRQDA